MIKVKKIHPGGIVFIITMGYSLISYLLFEFILFYLEAYKQILNVIFIITM
jgi:hypothetical protein